MVKKAKVINNKSTITLEPLTERQAVFLDSLENSPQVVVCGYSGTGKTYMAATYAAKLLQEGAIDKIILTRPNVSAGRDLGYFPGTEAEKITPWVAPVVDVLSKHLGKQETDLLIKTKVIEVIPMSTMRGKSFENAFVILDEAQNTTPAEIKMFLTRIGEGCKVVINGDIRQSDLRAGMESGLFVVVSMIQRYNLAVPIVDFQVEDIVRSKLCKQWIVAFERYKKDEYAA